MLSPKTRRNINRVIPFGVLWFIFSLIYAALEVGILGNMDHYPSTGIEYNFLRNILTLSISGLIMGFITGVLEIRFFNKWFIRKSFAKKIVLKSIIYLAIVMIFLAIALLINAALIQSNDATVNLFIPVWTFFTNYSLVGILLYVASIIIITQFYAEFNDSIGPGTLSNFFLGKYHHPIEEERIFMFLDMKSSTTIAQNLGHFKYFEMLKEYFFDLSNAVIDYGGIIYQYAGDEMIICWKLKDGIKNNNCIECFFEMKALMGKQAQKYNSTFGVVPEFKAGLHVGKVTAGEIGSLKKEIIFSGDVLNVSARIQALCNQLNVDILISKNLVNELNASNRYELTSKGEHLLKGRNALMEIYTISKS
ncbi:adenylate/guanylate cyclase domain-containing protein [Pedobacter lithocola]|uniref:Adenylate/guanylate cyclase domain-containing protein n=1 Tax=Pedobacter lithocola TaxID=1908239 RepID=A0ABV8PAQ5_9SPHI